MPLYAYLSLGTATFQIELALLLHLQMIFLIDFISSPWTLGLLLYTIRLFII